MTLISGIFVRPRTDLNDINPLDLPAETSTPGIGFVLDAAADIIPAPMKTLLGLFLLVGMLPGSLLPSFLTDRLLAPVLGKTEEKAEGASSIPPNECPKSDGAHLVATSYAATRPTDVQVAKDHARTIFTLEIQPTQKSDRYALLFVVQPADSFARLIETECRIAREPWVGVPQIRALAPPCLS